MKIKIFLLIMLILTISAPLHAGEILVSAAISLKDAFTDIAKDYEGKHPGDKVNLNFASSGQLRRQIEQGAKVDVFASASEKEMDILEGKGLIDISARRDFAANSLVIISGAKIDNIAELADKKFTRIAIGNPATVPAGVYAIEALEYYKIFDAIAERIVYAENVRQAREYVTRGEADAGIVYLSDALTIGGANTSIFKIDNRAHEDILYPISIVIGTENDMIAKRFIDFVVSDDAALILKKYGFNIKNLSVFK